MASSLLITTLLASSASNMCLCEPYALLSRYTNGWRSPGADNPNRTEIDQRIFGSSEMADAAFKISVTILQKLLDLGVKAFSGVVHRTAIHLFYHSLTNIFFSL